MMKLGKQNSSLLDERCRRAADVVQSARKVVALTGAGASTESGIPDFRSRGGLWSRFDPMEYATLGAFRRNPVKIWKMLAELLPITDTRPNRGHEAMAEMEDQGHLHGVITQNIDGLHQKAGSREVVEFHGSLATFSCLVCRMQYSLAQVKSMTLPPRCACREILKPDIVFFDEAIPPHALAMTEKLISSVDVLIVAGTSCQVAPASSIPFRVQQNGGKVLEINREPALEHMADIVLQGSFGATMTQLLTILEQ